MALDRGQVEISRDIFGRAAGIGNRKGCLSNWTDGSRGSTHPRGIERVCRSRSILNEFAFLNLRFERFDGRYRQMSGGRLFWLRNDARYGLAHFSAVETISVISSIISSSAYDLR